MAQVSALKTDLRQLLKNLKGYCCTGLSIGQCMVMVCKVKTTGRGNSLELMIGKSPSKVLTRCP